MNHNFNINNKKAPRKILQGKMFPRWDDVRTFFKDTKEDIQIPAFDLPASA